MRSVSSASWSVSVVLSFCAGGEEPARLIQGLGGSFSCQPSIIDTFQEQAEVHSCLLFISPQPSCSAGPHVSAKLTLRVNLLVYLCVVDR